MEIVNNVDGASIEPRMFSPCAAAGSTSMHLETSEVRRVETLSDHLLIVDFFVVCILLFAFVHLSITLESSKLSNTGQG